MDHSVDELDAAVERCVAAKRLEADALAAGVATYLADVLDAGGDVRELAVAIAGGDVATVANTDADADILDGARAIAGAAYGIADAANALTGGPPESLDAWGAATGALENLLDLVPSGGVREGRVELYRRVDEIVRSARVGLDRHLRRDEHRVALAGRLRRDLLGLLDERLAGAPLRAPLGSPRPPWRLRAQRRHRVTRRRPCRAPPGERPRPRPAQPAPAPSRRWSPRRGRW